MLLVEDDLESAKSMGVMLKRRNVAVRHVVSGEEAAAVFDADVFDVIVADVRLGDMTGMDVLRMVRKDNPDFPFIILTAYDNLETAIQAVQLGAHDYIIKPLLSIETLIEPVKRAIGHYNLVKENGALRGRLRKLASELLRVEEKERHRLASDLHDSVGQSLALAKIKIEQAMDEANPASRELYIAETLNIIEQVIHETRTLIFDLSPPILYDLGIECALDSLVVRTMKTEPIRIAYKFEKVSQFLSPEVSVVLFRAARELLFNAIKYAHAESVSMSIYSNDGRVHLVVEDNGIGFDVESVTSYSSETFGYGLFSIRERLNNYEGTMTIDSCEGKGTKVSLVVPSNAKNGSCGA